MTGRLEAGQSMLQAHLQSEKKHLEDHVHRMEVRHQDDPRYARLRAHGWDQEHVP